jgi:hypothetical protein
MASLRYLMAFHVNYLKNDYNIVLRADLWFARVTPSSGQDRAACERVAFASEPDCASALGVGAIPWKGGCAPIATV